MKPSHLAKDLLGVMRDCAGSSDYVVSRTSLEMCEALAAWVERFDPTPLADALGLELAPQRKQGSILR